MSEDKSYRTSLALACIRHSRFPYHVIINAIERMEASGVDLLALRRAISDSESLQRSIDTLFELSEFVDIAAFLHEFGTQQGRSLLRRA